MLVDRKRFFALLVIVWTIVAWFGVRHYTEERVSALLEADARRLEDDVSALEHAINTRLEHFATLPVLIAQQPAIAEALAHEALPAGLADDEPARREHWSARPDLKRLNEQLRGLAANLKLDAVFVLDDKGYCIASSNAATPESFIGTQYADRQYFTAALAGNPASQYAVGRKTNMPGLFFAVPMTPGEAGGQPPGVLVIKADIPTLAPLLISYDAFLTDSHGVVVLSSQPAWVSHIMPGGDFEQLRPEERQRLYKQATLPPLAREPLPADGNNPPMFSIEHAPHGDHVADLKPLTAIGVHRALPVGGLALHVFQPVTNALHARQEAPFITLISVLAGYFVLSLLYQAAAYITRMRASEAASTMQRQSLEDSLAEREQLLNTIINHLPQMVVARDARSGVILRSNPAAQTILQREQPLASGEPYAAQLAANIAEFLSPSAADAAQVAAAGEFREQTVDIGQHPRTLRAQTVAVREKAGTSDALLIDLVEDVTESREREREISRLAFVDSLTNLPNRAAFLVRLRDSIDEASRRGRFNALLLTDIDGFKLINDRLGHAAGDQILSELATRLAREAAQPCFVARLSSDEFVLILEADAGSAAQATEAATRFGGAVLERITAPYLINGHTLHLSASLGVTVFGPGLADNPGELLKETDAAMYEAKHSHRGGIHFFDEQVHKALDERSELSNRLLNALRSNNFQQFYQPQLDTTGRVVGVEALLRWQDAILGNVPPGVFIPLAEKLHIIVGIDRWVLHRACQTAGRWRHHEVLGKITISINVSAEFFGIDGFVDEVVSALSVNDALPRQLKIELTEGTIIEENERNQSCIEQLRAMGVTIAIDDFGTGNSSLSYLRRFTVDQIKIDQSFVANMLTEANSLAITSFVISLSRALKYQTLAEGVETQEQYAKLRELGCEYFQGYLFSRPAPLPECTDYILHRNAPQAA